jgi:hypothetical protein
MTDSKGFVLSRAQPFGWNFRFRVFCIAAEPWNTP